MNVGEKDQRGYGYESGETLLRPRMGYIQERTEQTHPTPETWMKIDMNQVSY